MDNKNNHEDSKVDNPIKAAWHKYNQLISNQHIYQNQIEDLQNKIELNQIEVSKSFSVLDKAIAKHGNSFILIGDVLFQLVLVNGENYSLKSLGKVVVF